MKTELIFIHKTSPEWLKQGVDEYLDRLKRYLQLDVKVLTNIKLSGSLPPAQQKQIEGEAILKAIESTDYIVLLDEKGKNLSSVELADFMQQRMNSGIKRLSFVTGGPYGFSDEVYKRADFQLSFSRMTYSHRMIRLLLSEQLYRAMSILRNEAYHNE